MCVFCGETILLCFFSEILVRESAMSGDLANGKVPEKLRPPTVFLNFIPHEDIHTKALEHARALSTVEAVWAVKMNDSSQVTPCGLAFVVAKQILCTPGVNDLV